MLHDIATSTNPAAQYLAHYTHEFYYLWDELEAAAWLDPKIITKDQVLFIDVDTTPGPNYGDTLSWSAASKPTRPMPPVHVQQDLDNTRFNNLFVNLMKSPPTAP
jgi:purine nucleosidase